MTPSTLRRSWPVLLVAALLLIFAALFLFEFISFDPQAEGTPDDDREARVLALLPDADATRGAALVSDSFECATCHVRGAQGGIAPAYPGLAERAGERVPGLTAEQYLYQSVVEPAAYVVEDYPPIMPANYGERLSNDQLADIIAYLLTQ